MAFSQLDRSIRAKLRMWLVVYPKAYSGDVLWPLALLLRRRTFSQVAATAAQLSARGRMLDIGTGPGHLPVQIASTCPHVQVVGVDISADLLYEGVKRARDRQVDARATFLQARAESLPFADNSFETALSMFSLHLWNDRQQGISEIRRVLIPGGRALILVGRQRLVKGLAYITDLVTGKSIKGMKESCLSAGFKEARIRERDGILQVLLTK